MWILGATRYHPQFMVARFFYSYNIIENTGSRNSVVNQVMIINIFIECVFSTSRAPSYIHSILCTGIVASKQYSSILYSTQCYIYRVHTSSYSSTYAVIIIIVLLSHDLLFCCANKYTTVPVVVPQKRRAWSEICEPAQWGYTGNYNKYNILTHNT